jgi:hypothetical protein
MIDPVRVDAALGPVRDLLRADGGDVDVVATADDSVVLALRLDDASCAECLMPRPFLETVALDLMVAALPGLRRVVIDDPREAGDAGASGPVRG